MMTEEQVKTLVETRVKYFMDDKKQQEETRKYLDAGWPTALIKAINDPFDYYMKLKNGDSFYFRDAARINEHWVCISTFNKGDGVVDTAHKMRQEHTNILGRYPEYDLFPRGLEVRVSEIVYIADAPHGS